MYKRIEQAIDIDPETTEHDSVQENEKEIFLSDEKEARILVVSDNASMTDRLKKSFSDTYDIVQRDDLSMIFQLFASVKRENIDLIIYYDSDPNKDLSIISMMKKYPRFSNVPIIVIAQEINEKRKMHYLDNDINDFIDIQNMSLIKQIVNSKIKNQTRVNSIINYSLTHNSGLDIITSAQMQIRTLADVAGASRTLKQFTNASIHQERAFFEIILNSLEHGQLGIDKEERRRTKKSGDYESYIDILASRNKEPIIVTYEKCEEYYLINVIDGGDGFNYKKYLKTNLSESVNEEEKGIYIANNTKNFNLKYNELGNIVQIRIPHKEKYKLWH